jgi:adenosylhomocysteine nucleosidase
MKADHFKFAVLVSANAEWKAVKAGFPDARIENSLYGECFFEQVDEQPVLFCHGGWGKVAAAASTQYVVDHFNPEYLINIGTCGGIEGRIRRFDVVVPDRVVIYDIHEAMGDDPREGVNYYTTELAIPAQFPTTGVRTTLYSADSDLTPARLRQIEDQYQPAVVDWESGAIAWVAKRNGTPLLILRGVSDLVSFEKAEAQGNEALFEQNARQIMQGLIRDLPKWMRALR